MLCSPSVPASNDVVGTAPVTRDCRCLPQTQLGRPQQLRILLASGWSSLRAIDYGTKRQALKVSHCPRIPPPAHVSLQTACRPCSFHCTAVENTPPAHPPSIRGCARTIEAIGRGKKQKKGLRRTCRVPLGRHPPPARLDTSRPTNSPLRLAAPRAAPSLASFVADSSTEFFSVVDHLKRPARQADR